MSLNSTAPSSAAYAERRKLLREVADKLCTYVDGMEDRSVPVVKLMTPEEMKASFETAGISLSLAADADATLTSGACEDDKPLRPFRSCGRDLCSPTQRSRNGRKPATRCLAKLSGFHDARCQKITWPARR